MRAVGVADVLPAIFNPQLSQFGELDVALAHIVMEARIRPPRRA